MSFRVINKIKNADAKFLVNIPIEFPSNMPDGTILIYDKTKQKFELTPLAIILDGESSVLHIYGEMCTTDEIIDMQNIEPYYPHKNMQSDILNGIQFVNNNEDGDSFVVNYTGDYYISISISLSSDANNTNVEQRIFINGAADNKLFAERNYKKDDPGSTSITGLVSLSQGDNIILKYKAHEPTTLIIHNVNFTIVKL